MNMTTKETDNNVSSVPCDLASILKGLYTRVSKKLKCSPSYVSRVARGERHSQEVMFYIQLELKRALELSETYNNFTDRRNEHITKKNKKPRRRLVYKRD